MVKVYAHYEPEGEGGSTLPLEVADAVEAVFGQVKKRFIQHLNDTNQKAPKYENVCFYNNDQCPISDISSLATFMGGDNDFFLRPVPGEANALGANIRNKKDLSYYYAHDRRPLIKKMKEVTKAEAQAQAAPPRPPPLPSGAPVANKRHSPFGTDVMAYESITSYSWEDYNKQFVKVSINFDGVGGFGDGAVRANFGERQFEVLIDTKKGAPTKKYRFACSKTHAEMNAAECSYAVRSNRVTLKLRKAKDDDVWFDLFKKRAIGDNDPP